VIRRPPVRDAFSIGGWLFADLMLVLVLVFLAAGSVGSAAATPPPTQLAGTEPSPAASDCRLVAVLDKQTVEVAPASRGTRASDAAILKALGRFTGRRAGIILTFGHGATIAQGMQWAEDVNSMLRKRLPSLVTDRTITEDYFSDTAGPTGTISFDVYLLGNDCP